MTIGRVVGRGGQAAVALAVAVLGLTWLNLVASAVMSVGGSCASGGPYEVATPCPQGVWMAPVGILVGLVALGVYAIVRPPGSPSLVLFAWPALFVSLGIQFLRAAAAESDAWGFWLCGLLFLAMGGAPLVLALVSDPRAVVRVLLGDGRAEPEPSSDPASAPLPFPVNLVEVDSGDLAENLDRLSRLHRCGDLSDAEYADAKQKVLDGA